jgi:hypothetical protein
MNYSGFQASCHNIYKILLEFIPLEEERKRKGNNDATKMRYEINTGERREVIIPHQI